MKTHVIIIAQFITFSMTTCVVMIAVNWLTWWCWFQKLQSLLWKLFWEAAKNSAYDCLLKSKRWSLNDFNFLLWQNLKLQYWCLDLPRNKFGLIVISWQFTIMQRPSRYPGDFCEIGSGISGHSISMKMPRCWHWIYFRWSNIVLRVVESLIVG